MIYSINRITQTNTRCSCAELSISYFMVGIPTIRRFSRRLPILALTLPASATPFPDVYNSNRERLDRICDLRAVELLTLNTRGRRLVLVKTMRHQ